MANKPYSVVWPLKPESAGDIDRMFKDLYQQVATLQTGTPTTPAQVLARVLLGT